MEHTYTDIFNAAENITESGHAKSLLHALLQNRDSPWETSILTPLHSLEAPTLGRTAAVFLIFTVLVKLFSEVFTGKKAALTAQYVLHCLFAVTFLLQFYPTLETVAVYMRDVLSFLGILFPTLGTILASGGNVATATTSGIGQSLFLSVAQLLIQSILPSVFTFFCGMALLDAFFGDGRFLQLSSALKNIFFTAFAVLLSIFFIVMRTQNIAAESGDAASAGALRLLVAKAVPIVGGTIGDALRFVGAGLIRVKSAVGTAAVVFLLGMYLPVFLHLFGQGILLSLFQFLCGFFSISEQKEVYTHMKYATDFLLAVYSSVFVIGMINIGTFMQTVPTLAI